MIAHELHSPLAAVRRQLDLLADPPTWRPAGGAGGRTCATRWAAAAVNDAQLVATIERDEFTVFPRSVRLRPLLDRGPSPAAGQAQPVVQVDEADVERARRRAADRASAAESAGQRGRVYALRHAHRADRARPGWTRLHRGHRPRGWPVAWRTPSGCSTSSNVVARMPRRRWRDAGSGLYLSRQIVRAHGAELEVSPTPGGGATFSFSLEPG